MDIQAEKLQLIEWLVKLNNANVLKRFIALKNEQEGDWWDQLTKEEKKEIEEGLAQAIKVRLSHTSRLWPNIKNGVSISLD